MLASPCRHLIARDGTGDGSRYNYLGLLNGRPVSTAVLFEGKGAAGIYYVGTLPDARNMGIATAMMQHVPRAAKARGYSIATLNASAAGQPVYRRPGFADCFATASITARLALDVEISPSFCPGLFHIGT